jgi:hypothetical protein
MTKNTQAEKTPDKRILYKTAQALIGCAYFKKGDFVAVNYYGRGYSGENSGHYFLCNAANDERQACYPEHHLTRFCL